MLVVDVWTLRVPSMPRLSAGRPLLVYVMATKDAQVVEPYCCNVAFALALPSVATADAPGRPGLTTATIAMATRSRNRRPAPSESPPPPRPFCPLPTRRVGTQPYPRGGHPV